MYYYELCTFCGGFGQPGPGCSCDKPCRFGGCPAQVERQRAAGVECVTYSPDYEPQPVPVLVRPRKPVQDWCRNCREAPATTTRGGYRCCEGCSVEADLPTHMRRST